MLLTLGSLMRQVGLASTRNEALAIAVKQARFPMTDTIGELDEALRLLARAERELAAEGLEAAPPRVGVAIKVPASLFLVGAMARRVDAFSIGTNDLTQYMLAVDRNNTHVVTPYDSLHPAVLDAIRRVVESAHRHGKRVSVCGEMAGDPEGALLLLGLGIDSLSMSPSLLGEVKSAIRCVDRRHARALADAALRMEDGFAIHRTSAPFPGRSRRPRLSWQIRCGRRQHVGRRSMRHDRQQSLELFSDYLVALAHPRLQALTVQHLDMAAAVANQPRALQFSGGFGHTLAPDAQHVGDQLLRHMDFVRGQAVQTE
jgi:hypothetical protein